jgi:hypothetical protein
MSEYGIIQIVRTLVPGLIALGVGGVAVGVGIAIKAMVGGSRKRLNDLSERVLYLEERLARSSSQSSIGPGSAGRRIEG